MKHLNLNLIGGFGNRCMQYCAMRGFAEQHGFELRTTPWVGQKIFYLPEHPAADLTTPRRTETQLLDNPEGDVSVEGYFQNQRAIDYWSKSKAVKWLRFSNELFRRDSMMPGDTHYIACHLRRGDYLTNGAYPIISRESYEKFLRGCYLGATPVHWISEETPRTANHLPLEFSFLPDFYCMIKAYWLLRANSTFSWFAHVLADDSQRVFSPRIDGKPGGVEVDCDFEEGNHCRLSDHDFCSDLILKP